MRSRADWHCLRGWQPPLVWIPCVGLFVAEEANSSQTARKTGQAGEWAVSNYFAGWSWCRTVSTIRPSSAYVAALATRDQPKEMPKLKCIPANTIGQVSSTRFMIGSPKVIGGAVVAKA